MAPTSSRLWAVAIPTGIAIGLASGFLGIGGGIRAILQESFVGRVDVGVGLDPVRERDGRIVNETSWGIYIVFDHAF